MSKNKKREPKKYESASLSVLFAFAALLTLALQIFFNDPNAPLLSRAFTGSLFAYAGIWLLKHDFECMCARRLFIESFFQENENAEAKS
jgi:hypothetical protein